MKVIHIILFFFISLSIAGISLPSAAFIFQPDKTRTLNNKQIEQWRTDIDFLHKELERRHIDLYHTTKPDFFDNERTRIKQQLPSLTETGLAIELMRLIQQVGDGHTQFAYWGGEHHRYILELGWFDNELRVIGVEQQHRQLLGSTLVAIEDTPMTEARTKLETVLQGVENSYSARQRLCETITVAEILHGLKISQNLHQTSFRFKLAHGEERNISLNSLAAGKFSKTNMVSLKPSIPDNFSTHKISIDGLSLQLGNNNKIAYLDFYHYPGFSAMQDFAKDLINLLRAQNTKEVIIDLRKNGGGDFFVGLQLAWALIMVDNLNWRDGIYVLTGPKTFSAAMSNAVQYRQLLNATLVGEPTGANPVGYQDAGSFKLPNSGWTVMYSKRMYRFQESPTAGAQPDIFLTPDWELLKQGRDNQLEWILEDIRKRKKD